MPRLAQQRAAHALLGLGCVLLAAFLVTAVSAGAPLGIPSDLLYDAVVVLGTLVVALRAACVREDRVAWALVAAAICASTAGDLLNSVLYPRAEDLPVPSWCDPLWLGFYPPMLIACGLLARRRRHGLRSGMWLDGVAGALAAAAVVSAALLEPLLADAAPQRTIELLTNVAYPVGDLVVVAALVTTTALAAWQLDRRWLLLITGVLAYVAADGAYLLTAAAGTYVDGGVTDAGWVVAALAFGAAAWAPRAPDADSPAPGRGTVVAPVVFAAIALAVVLQQAFARPYPLTLVLAVATLGVVVGRLTLVHADHQQRLRESRLDAATDELTGLWNRRRLMADLAAAVSDGAQRVLLLLDLDGFKGYNDTFGHPAGDRLLRVIGGHLHDVVARRGTAYRLGGDEFCALLDLGPSEEPMAAGAAVAAAIESRGDGFRVGASFGVGAASGGGDRAVRRRCGSPTTASTPRRTAGAPPRRARAPTCCVPCWPPATPSSTSTPSMSERWPRPSGAGSGWARARCASCAARPSCTTSASSCCPRRSWPSRPASTPASGRSYGATP